LHPSTAGQNQRNPLGRITYIFSESGKLKGRSAVRKKKYERRTYKLYIHLVFFRNRISPHPAQARGTNISQTIQGRRHHISDRKWDDEVGEKKLDQANKASS